MRDHAPKKSLGQHWLSDENMLKAIVEAADAKLGDTVLEIGPGQGTLTAILAGTAQRVVAVEYDHHLAEQLPATVPAENLEVIEADILDFNLSHPTLANGYKVVANIPYYLTSHLVRRLLEAENQPEKIALLIQKEVAERIVASPGQMSILAVASQFYADCSLDIVVPAEYFDPPPKVDSQVVVLIPKAKPPDVNTKQFFRFVRAGFGEKRKKLVNSLAGGLQLDKALVAKALASVQLHENVRAQELDVATWLKLYEELKNEL